MDDWRCLSLAVLSNHIENITIAVPRASCSSEWVIPSKVNANDLRPNLRDIERFANNIFFWNRKYSPGPKRWNALRPGLAFMRWVARYDPRPIFISVMFRVIDCHCDNMTIRAFLHYIPRDNIRHTFERSECYPDKPLGCVRPGNALKIHIRWGFFIEVHIMHRVCLPLTPALLICLEQKR